MRICRTRVESARDSRAAQLAPNLFFDGLASATHLHRIQTISALFLQCHAATTVFLRIEHMIRTAVNGVNHPSRFHISVVVFAELI